MNDRDKQLTHEIAALQLRVDQLASSCVGADEVLSSLAVEVEAAASGTDPMALERLARKMSHLRQRRLMVSNEMGTLQELIAARRGVGKPALEL